MDNKFVELDKAMSAKIAEEFRGKEWEVDCSMCSGCGYWPTPYNRIRKKRTCKGCGGKGKYLMSY